MRVPRFKSRDDTKVLAINYCDYDVAGPEDEGQARNHTPTHK